MIVFAPMYIKAETEYESQKKVAPTLAVGTGVPDQTREPFQAIAKEYSLQIAS